MKDERLMMTVEELAQRNGANLLAHQLQTELRNKIERAQEHADELEATCTQLNQAQRIGIEVMRAHHNGRKTIRLADLLE